MLRKILVLIVLSLTITLTACDSSKEEKQVSEPTKASAEIIQANNAYVRAMPPGQKVTAAFLELKNTSSKKMALVSVESNISEFVELHAHTMVDGMMNMGQVDEIIIPKNGSVALETGGYHIMMINLKKDLVVGQKVDLKLVFKDGTSLLIHPEIMKK